MTGFLCSIATPAAADWLVNPFAGVTFEGEGSNKQLAYGGSIGFMGAGVIGLEFDAGVVPDFFGASEGLAETNLATLMGNVIIGAPLGSPGARPYVSGGLGVIRSRADVLDDLIELSDDNLGMNVGVGVMAFFSDHAGIRGDVRYFRSIRNDSEGDDFDLDLGSFDFWRATAGVTFRF
jgi:hypothetical protein